jgi:hypothetical protein
MIWEGHGVADRNLKLNSLSRYSKESPLLILEEHGHCEVPAGCGGVVLRWRDPRTGVPLTVRLYAAGECGVLLDGQSPSSARSIVPFGQHAFGFVVSGFDPAYLVLMFVAANEPPSNGASREEDPVSIVTQDDGSWRYTLNEPDDDDWLRPGFDDSGWPAMLARPQRRPPADPKRDFDRYQVERLAEAGAVGLGVADGTRAWIRREFTLGQPVAGSTS